MVIGSALSVVIEHFMRRIDIVGKELKMSHQQTMSCCANTSVNEAVVVGESDQPLVPPPSSPPAKLALIRLLYPNTSQPHL